MKHIRNKLINCKIPWKKQSRLIWLFACFVVLSVVVVRIGVFNEKQSFPELSSNTLLTASSISTTKLATTSKSIIPKDWATISSKLGFSLKYPYKEIGAGLGDDGVFQAIIFFPPSIISISISTAENIFDDIQGIGLDSGIMILVIEDNTAKTNFKSWIKTYLANKNNQYGKDDTVLSENTTSTIFAGLKGYLVTRLIQGSKSQLNPHYTRKDIFITKGKYVYRISTIAPSSDTALPRSGLFGKQYLQRVDKLSAEVLKTFIFDKSTNNAIVVPRISAPKLTGDANVKREKLLSILRTEPFFDNNKTYQDPYDKCASGISASSNTDISKQDLDLFQAIYVSVNGGISDTHAYDSKGGHTGLMPKIPGIDFDAPIENNAYEINFSSFSKKQTLSIRENIDGKIEIVGKEYGMAEFEMRGEGNSCGITDIYIPVTPYSIATLQMTKQGDIGPISYDIDGDGKQDFILSLSHPLLPEKQNQLDAVISDMKGAK